MRERIEARLGELRAELEVGRGMLAELDARRANLNGSMLRIGGAIQALEELLRDEAGAGDGGPLAADPARDSGRPLAAGEV